MSLETVTLEDWLREPEPPTTMDIPDGMALLFLLLGGKIAVQEVDGKLAIWCDKMPLKIQKIDDRKIYIGLG